MLHSISGYVTFQMSSQAGQNGFADQIWPEAIAQTPCYNKE